LGECPVHRVLAHANCEHDERDDEPEDRPKELLEESAPLAFRPACEMG
jgi:hypothetical protein